MSAVIANRDDESEQSLPWYRYGWPWFLISIPLVSVALGSVMLYLAFNANNSLVVDDYYKEGKAYNLRIERDRLASLLGISAQLRQTSEGLIVQLGQVTPADMPASLLDDAKAANDSFAMPESLRLRWVHVTQAKRDGETTLQSIGAGRFISPGSVLPEQGKFRIHIEPLSDVLSVADEPDGFVPDSWRLISVLTGFTDGESILMPALEPEKVFTGAMLQ